MTNIYVIFNTKSEWNWSRITHTQLFQVLVQHLLSKYCQKRMLLLTIFLIAYILVFRESEMLSLSLLPFHFSHIKHYYHSNW